MNHPNSYHYVAPAVCATCAGTGTTLRGVIRLRLRTCRACHGSRFALAVTR